MYKYKEQATKKLFVYMAKGLPHPMLGKKHSEETKKKISEASRGHKLSKETKKKMSESRTGRKHTEETRKKISESHKGEKHYFYGKKFSEEYRKKISKGHILRREKHWNWQGGITPENVKIRTNIEIRLWREAVFARDNWTCQKCNNKSGDFNAHHIQNFSKEKELRTSIENGITLCKICHQNFHQKYSYKNNTKEQLMNYVIKKLST